MNFGYLLKWMKDFDAQKNNWCRPKDKYSKRSRRSKQKAKGAHGKSKLKRKWGRCNEKSMSDSDIVRGSGNSIDIDKP